MRSHLVTILAVLAIVLASAPRPALAADPAGTFDDPIIVDLFPYAHAATTVDRASAIDSYSCAPTTPEGGGDVVYQLTTASSGRLYLDLRGDTDSVDVDIHLLAGTTVSSGVAQDCLARNNTVLATDVAAGTYYVVVDTYSPSATPQPGPYELRIDFVADGDFRETVVANGVVWGSQIYQDLYGGVQTVNVLDVDLAAPDLEVKPVDANGCETTSAMGVRTEATAGINGGFFAMGNPQCPSSNLVKIDGTVVNLGTSTHTTFGIDATGTTAIAMIAAGVDWPEMVHALGAGPNLVTDGALDVTQEGFSWMSSKEPRSALGVTADGHLLLVTFDGRTEHGDGTTIPELADYLLNTLGAYNAMNLDGGGSTTLYVAGATANGVVNYPSGGTQRAVSNGLYVWASPYDHPPRFTTTPGLDATAGVAWTYDADALDLDLDPLTFALASGPAAMTVAAATGEASWTPDWRDAGELAVSITVADATNVVPQDFTLAVVAPDADGDGMPDGCEQEYGIDDPAADPDGDGSSNLQECEADTDPLDASSHPDVPESDAGVPDDAGAAPGAAESEGGCGCRLVAPPTAAGPVPPAGAAGLAMLGALGVVRRSRRRSDSARPRDPRRALRAAQGRIRGSFGRLLP